MENVHLPSFTAMTTGRDRRPPAPAPTRARSGGGLLRAANVPYLLVIAFCLGALIPFVVAARPFETEDAGTAAPTTTAPTTTTTTSGDPAATTLPGTVDTTVPTSSTTSTRAPDGLPTLDLQVVATGIAFPTFAISPPGDDRVFVLERQGRVRLVDPAAGLLDTPFLNLMDRVGSGGVENGLLGMAFHPDFADNGRFYLSYTTTDLNSRISEFRIGNPDSDTANPNTEEVLLEVAQRGIRHRGGMLQFGPDGTLYASLGDGGMGDAAAQDLSQYQGKILRIDVDAGDPYDIPDGNPFATGEGLGEIWAYGLRNPWRFDIDPVDGLIFIADVGQAAWEEVNVQPLTDAGLDYGWPNFEGTDCYKPTAGCDITGWIEPTVAYSHEEGCSIAGGYVYRGTAIPELTGHYFYADWCNGWIRSFRYAEGEVTQENDWSTDLDGAGAVASFGEDGGGELLVVDSNGTVYRVVRAG